MALCSDNSVLSGLVRVCCFCSGAHWQAGTAPPGEGLQRGGGGGKRKGEGGREIHPRQVQVGTKSNKFTLKVPNTG